MQGGRRMSSKVETALTERRKLLSLVLLGATQFMVVLDVAIINVALPTIQKALKFPFENLQWVTTAYAITFGGLLLLGGRAADLLGRRRMFMIGMGLFAAASLACGLAGSIGVLVAARAVQGVGAAIISPATLSIITTTFEEGSERNKAIGIWGAMAGSGAAAGVLAGGLLTKYAGWEWIFFVNVPVGAIVLAVTRTLALLVYAISKAPDVGWSSGRTIGLLVAVAVLLALFAAIELRHPAPM